MTLRQQQSLFVMLVGNLIEHVYSAGFEATFGEAWRTPEQAEWYAERNMGIRHSLHTERLAIDLNLFRDGQLVATVEGYRPIGEYWESLHELARWGGRFSRPDADHFSLAWNGAE